MINHRTLTVISLGFCKGIYLHSICTGGNTSVTAMKLPLPSVEGRLVDPLWSINRDQ